MADQGQAKVDYGAAPLGLGLTRQFAAFVADAGYDDLPDDARKAARRGVLDWIGCALAGSRHATAHTLIATLTALQSSQTATVLGHKLRMGLLEASMANGQMGHVLDFDDTHMGGVILHASSPILSALLAVAETRKVTGPQLMIAYALGFEAGVRVGRAAPLHHPGGWHLTGTLGTIAAAVAVAKVLGLDAARTTNAIALAATQAAGMQQNRGTMAKSFHAGKAASNGLLAALLAENGYDGSDEILEGKRGFCRIYSTETDEAALLDQLGRRWEIARNGHKPYACGVVLHPAIDAMIALGNQAGKGAPVSRIELQVNPAAISITGVANPRSGLKSKFSLTYTAAISFLDRAAGIDQFSDASTTRRDVPALASLIEVTAQEKLARDQASATVWLAGGDRFTHRVEHASGTADNPMSDAALHSKFTANAVPAIGANAASRLSNAIDGLEQVDDVAELARIAA
jgi:2-methylcitrate dehydratase PrpD